MIKIGIIGMSEGNGHPYSWSAIINGEFDREEMDKCGFAGIPLYLEANNDTLGIDGAQVTHVWTQDRKISEHIARASMIENVVNHAEEMIGQVDAVLDADVPIFIDKPLVITTNDLAYFVEQNEKGKLFMSSSSMRYSCECRTAKTELASLGKLELATVVGKKDWIKYGVHMLEALFALLDDPKAVSVQHLGESQRDIVLIKFENDLLATAHLFMDIAATFQLTLFGSDGWRLIDIKNSYSMFKDNLVEFIRSVREGRSRLLFEKTQNIIRTLIGAKQSLEQQGKMIDLTI
jgi:hypothetical protein